MSDSEITPEGENLAESGELAETPELHGLSLKEELHKIVQSLTTKEALPDVIEQFVEHKKLNRMVLDLYDYDKGYEILFRKHGSDEEIFHGAFSYAVPIIEYIRDGQMPYEMFDKLYNYKFPIFYDGFVVCELRLNFGLDDNTRSHYVLLRHTIQTIDAQCLMMCKMAKSLKFEEERARLINSNSPDLCLDPNPAVADDFFFQEFNHTPFITPYLKK